MSFNNAVYGDNGRVVGFRCDVCDQVKTKMWGTARIERLANDELTDGEKA